MADDDVRQGQDPEPTDQAPGTPDQDSGENGDEEGCQPPPETGCDTGVVDEVACKAKGVAAEAAYNATYAESLAAAKTAYDTTRKDYRAKRQEAMLTVQDLRNQIKHLLERIRCLIEQKRVWKCLDKAFCEIVEELRNCPDLIGCCVGECTFDSSCTDLEYDELVARLTSYQQQADAAKACFDRLVGEPAALTARVAAAKDAVNQITTALAADPATTDLKRVYAQALVADRDIDRIWGGFDQIHDFVDCLCRALTCWTQACEAVSALTGCKAVAECKRDAEAEHCAKLKSEPVEEILAAYDRLCPKPSCEERPEPSPEPCTEDEDDCHDEDCHHKHDHGCDCGCHHDCGCSGHHHRRHHHHRHHRNRDRECDCGCGEDR